MALAFVSILLFVFNTEVNFWIALFAALFAVLSPALAIWDKAQLKDSTISVPVLAMLNVALSVAMWGCYAYRLYGNYNVAWQKKALIVGLLAAAVALIPYVRCKREKDKVSDEEQLGNLEEYKRPNTVLQVIAIACLICSLTGNPTAIEAAGTISVLLIIVPQLIANLCIRTRKYAQQGETL